MVDTNGRAYPRYGVDSQTKVEIVWDNTDGKKYSGIGVNISRTGAYLNGISTTASTNSGIVKFFSAEGDLVFERHFNVKRSARDEGHAIKFNLPLKGKEIAEIADIPDVGSSLDLARADYEIVNNEISVIRESRNTIFIGLLAALGAWVIAAIGLAPSLFTTQTRLLIGAMFPFFCLTIAILASIEQANAINLRKGFLAAITDFLRANAAPPYYLGWSHLRCNFGECKLKPQKRPCGRDDDDCFIEARKQFTKLLNNRNIFANIFSLSGSLAGWTYAILYGFSIALSIYAILYAFRDKIPLNFIIVGISTAFILCFSIYIGITIIQLRKGAKSLEAYYFQWKIAMKHCIEIKASKPSPTGLQAALL